MSEPIVKVESLTKLYGDYAALRDITLSVPRGSVFGLLGTNGAGKTTLLRIINSILVSDAGSVSIDGIPASLSATSSLVGYMPEERGLYQKMRVDEQIRFFGTLKGCPEDKLMQNMHDYMELFEISEKDRHRRVEELSKGNQQKVQIIATVVHDPKLIILDEPFSGFDPINGQLLQGLIGRLREKGCTLMLSSHNMPSIEQMCTHIALLNRGRILLDGELEEIKEQHRTGRIYVGLNSQINEPLLLDSGIVAEITRVSPRRKSHGGAYEILPKPEVNGNDLLTALMMQANILEYEELLPSLADLFISYTQEDNSNE